MRKSRPAPVTIERIVRRCWSEHTRSRGINFMRQQSMHEVSTLTHTYTTTHTHANIYDRIREGTADWQFPAQREDDGQRTLTIGNRYIKFVLKHGESSNQCMWIHIIIIFCSAAHYCMFEDSEICRFGIDVTGPLGQFKLRNQYDTCTLHTLCQSDSLHSTRILILITQNQMFQNCYSYQKLPNIPMYYVHKHKWSQSKGRDSRLCFRGKHTAQDEIQSFVSLLRAKHLTRMDCCHLFSFYWSVVDNEENAYTWYTRIFLCLRHIHICAIFVIIVGSLNLPWNRSIIAIIAIQVLVKNTTPPLTRVPLVLFELVDGHHIFEAFHAFWAINERNTSSNLCSMRKIEPLPTVLPPPVLSPCT